MLAWHYTTNDRKHAPQILLDGYLKPGAGTQPDQEDELVRTLQLPRATIRRMIAQDQATKAAVWFSLDQWYETSTSPRESISEIHERYGLIRIGIDPSSCPLTWEDYCRESGHSAATIRSMKKLSYKIGSKPSHYRWRGDRVPKSEWLAVERFDGSRWLPLEAKVE